MFTPNPTEIDITSPDVPVLLVEDAQGTEYRGQYGGVASVTTPRQRVSSSTSAARVDCRNCLMGRTTAGGGAALLTRKGLAELDRYFGQLHLPLRVVAGWNWEGWVSVEGQERLPEKWQYLAGFEGRKAILLWNNCD